MQQNREPIIPSHRQDQEQHLLGEHGAELVHFLSVQSKKGLQQIKTIHTQPDHKLIK
jgi:hypothetical protein